MESDSKLQNFIVMALKIVFSAVSVSDPFSFMISQVIFMCNGSI